MTRFRDFCFALTVFAFADTALAQTACQLETIGIAKVASIRDGGALMLEDGREIRLAAVDVPASTAAKAALQTMTANQTLTLKRLGAATEDRYGRVPAFAFLADGNSLQQALLAQGAARVSLGGGACTGDWLKAEQAARAAKTGIWADPNFALLPAESSARITAEKGRFAVIEGKVLSVREAGGTIYMNFGTRWSRDFSITIFRRNQRMFTSAGVEPKKLEGRRVRVRGWIEQRRGPIIDATHPEQIEIVE